MYNLLRAYITCAPPWILSTVQTSCLGTLLLSSSWILNMQINASHDPLQEVLHVAQTEMQLAACGAFLQILQKDLIALDNYAETFLPSILTSLDNRDPGTAFSVQYARIHCNPLFMIIHFPKWHSKLRWSITFVKSPGFPDLRWRPLRRDQRQMLFTCFPFNQVVFRAIIHLCISPWWRSLRFVPIRTSQVRTVLNIIRCYSWQIWFFSLRISDVC